MFVLACVCLFVCLFVRSVVCVCLPCLMLFTCACGCVIVRVCLCLSMLVCLFACLLILCLVLCWFVCFGPFCFLRVRWCSVMLLCDDVLKHSHDCGSRRRSGWWPWNCFITSTLHL